MTDPTDMEKEALMFQRQDRINAVIKDGWMRVQMGKAAYYKDGKYLDKGAMPCPAPNEEIDRPKRGRPKKVEIIDAKKDFVPAPPQPDVELEPEYK